MSRKCERIWTRGEEDILRALHGKVKTREMARRLRRTQGSVRGKLCHMGLAKPRGYFSPFTFI